MTAILQSSKVVQRFQDQPDRDKSLSEDERQVLDSELNAVLDSIREASSFDAADEKLLRLGEIQTLLAILAFRFDVGLSDRQKRIVREYDRWDLREERNRLFEAIKQGTF